MLRYQHPDLTFEAPKEWVDRSVTIYAAPVKPGQKCAPNLVLTREPVESTERVASYTDRQLVELAKRLDEFDLLERREFTLGGLPAASLVFTWVSGKERLQQKVVFVLVRGWAMLAFTITSLKEDFAEQEPALQAMFDSIRFSEVKERLVGFPANRLKRV